MQFKENEIMKLKTILFILLAAIIGIFGTTKVNAATISEDGKYTLVLNTTDGNIDGEYSKIIRFNVEEGETTVKLSELT